MSLNSTHKSYTFLSLSGCLLYSILMKVLPVYSDILKNSTSLIYNTLSITGFVIGSIHKKKPRLLFHTHHCSPSLLNLSLFKQNMMDPPTPNLKCSKDIHFLIWCLFSFLSGIPYRQRVPTARTQTRLATPINPRDRRPCPWPLSPPTSTSESQETSETI